MTLPSDPVFDGSNPHVMADDTPPKAEHVPQANPYSQMCVITHNGKEVGLIAAASNGAARYINQLASQYGSISVGYVEDSAEAMIDQAVHRGRIS